MKVSVFFFIRSLISRLYCLHSYLYLHSLYFSCTYPAIPSNSYIKLWEWSQVYRSPKSQSKDSTLIFLQLSCTFLWLCDGMPDLRISLNKKRVILESHLLVTFWLKWMILIYSESELVGDGICKYTDPSRELQITNWYSILAILLPRY